MKDFLARFNMLVLPRVRDFEGLDMRDMNTMGSFKMTIENQDAFKELDAILDQRELVHGFEINIDTTCFTQEEGLKLFKEYGFPFAALGPPREKPPVPEWKIA